MLNYMCANFINGGHCMWFVKKYDELELDELEEILGLRQDIFIMEQESFFRDIDGRDQDAIHVFHKDEGVIKAYCRMEETDHVYISRVIVNSEYRGQGFGREIFRYGVALAKERNPGMIIRITAMSYLTDFYQSFGFKAISDDYDIAGHDHIDMELTP